MVSTSWDNLTDGQRDELTQAALRAQESDEGMVGGQPQDVAGNNAALLVLQELFDGVADFQRMSLREWRTVGENLLDDQKPTLLLFDRSFERDGGSATGGDDLVRGVLERADRDHVYVGLLTHTATDEGREKEIAAEISNGLDTVRPVIVVAKHRLQDQQFPQALRLVLFATEIEAFRSHAVESISQANAEAIKALKGVDLPRLLAAFEAAREEGLYETDYAMRIAATFARKSLAVSLRDAAFVRKCSTSYATPGPSSCISMVFHGRLNMTKFSGTNSSRMGNPSLCWPPHLTLVISSSLTICSPKGAAKVKLAFTFSLRKRASASGQMSKEL